MHKYNEIISTLYYPLLTLPSPIETTSFPTSLFHTSMSFFDPLSLTREIYMNESRGLFTGAQISYWWFHHWRKWHLPSQQPDWQQLLGRFRPHPWWSVKGPNLMQLTAAAMSSWVHSSCHIQKTEFHKTFSHTLDITFFKDLFCCLFISIGMYATCIWMHA